MGLSTHVLDVALGAPVADLPVRLERWEGTCWRTLAEARTNADGRCRPLPEAEPALAVGQYRLRFETGVYFAARALASLYPFVEITFEVKDERHHHIPLLLTANGFSTYRGS